VTRKRTKRETEHLKRVLEILEKQRKEFTACQDSHCEKGRSWTELAELNLRHAKFKMSKQNININGEEALLMITFFHLLSLWDKKNTTIAMRN
jgi:hypothetical protein